MTATRLEWIPSGDAGTIATVNRMQTLTRHAAVTSVVRDVAARLVLGVDYVPMLHARILRDFVTSHTRFLPDPTPAEGLTPPDDLIRRLLQVGIVQGDCDDIAMMAAALGLSIGLRAQFVVAAFHAPSAPFSHVWCDLGDPSGREWLSIDPSRTSQAFHAISRTLTFEV